MITLAPVLIIIGLFLASLVIPVYRFWRNNQTKRFGGKLVRSLDENPHFAEEIAGELLNLYGSKPDNSAHLTDAPLDFSNFESLGKFQILRKIVLNSGDVLFVTICHAKGYDITPGGGFQDVSNVHHLNFVVRRNRDKRQVEVYSDYYESLPLKFLRQEFAQEILKKLALPVASQQA